MVDEQQPAKKVVKRVVKKTVVRPAADEPTRTVRYGRVVATPPKPQAKAAARPVARAGSTTTRPRPEVGAKVGAAGKALGARGSSVASGTARGIGSASRATGTFVADRTRATLAWRIPHLEPRLASVITGALVGLVSVGLGLAALQLFTEVRGVASGGGRWGSLTFVVVTFIAFVLGELLLSAFGTSQPRVTSLLGVVLTIVAILGLFLGLADSVWALVLVPVLNAVTFLVAHLLFELAENSPTLPE